MYPVLLLSGADQPRANYEAAVHAAGGAYHSFYLPEPSHHGYDGLILCGGGDVAPERFGQPNRGSQGIDPSRDEAELALAAAFAAAGKPILGICRGMQVVNVALGGTLLQDLPPITRAYHRSSGQGDLLHPTQALPGSFLHQLYGPHFTVNSAHHQAIGRLGAGLSPAQWSEDGCVEGVVHATLPIWGVQWHPERLCLSHARTDAVDGLALFRYFLAACGG